MIVAILHSSGLHDELIITMALVDMTFINHLTRQGYVEVGLLTGFKLFGKDMPIPCI
jgi:hypothetical protein